MRSYCMMYCSLRTPNSYIMQLPGLSDASPHFFVTHLLTLCAWFRPRHEGLRYKSCMTDRVRGRCRHDCQEQPFEPALDTLGYVLYVGENKS